MNLTNWFGARKATKDNKPREMVFRFLPSSQVIWFEQNPDNYLKKGYLGNHAIFTIQDWKASKVASCPPILYEIKDDRSYKKYRALLKDATYESINRSHEIKTKALEEVENTAMMSVLDHPNEIMNYYEFVYGHTVFKDIVGSAYWSAVRDGINDPTTGKIRELWLMPSQLVQIESGGVERPIDHYFLSSNPDVKISRDNVCQFRNFSPAYENNTQWLYGMSRLSAASKILQKYNDGTEVEVDLWQKKGIRDIVFPKGKDLGYEQPTPEQVQASQDAMNRRLSRPAGEVIANSIELGSIRVGLNPQELGVLESNKVTKKDFCALYHIPSEIFDWSDQSTYNNVSEARKRGLVDAVIPELEQLKDGLNRWFVPSWYNGNSRHVIDFDYEFFPEMQQDTKTLVEWMDKAGCFTVNEKRAALRYDAISDENADKILIPANLKLLENMGLDSFDTDPSVQVFEE